VQVERLTQSEWARTFESVPLAQREIYWHPAFAEASAKREGADAMCFRVRQGESVLLYPFLRHAIDGAPGVFDAQTPYGYGGPLWWGGWGNDDARAALSAIAEGLVEDGVIAELVRCHPYWSDAAALAAGGYELLRARTNVECRLDWPVGSDPTSWASVARRNLRRSRRAGLAWRPGTPEDVGAFLRLYDLTYERVGMSANYRVDRAYVEALTGSEPGLGSLLLVEAPGTSDAIAAAIVLIGGRDAFYHLGGSDLAYKDLRPNEHLYWAMAEFARAQGCERIVWGGGTSSDPDDTLFRFKRHFGDTLTAVFVAGRILEPARFATLSADWERRNPERAATSRLYLRYRG
jgi:hypothetical protein